MKGNLQIARCLIGYHQLPDNQGYTPLHYACMDGYVDVAKLLLQHGAQQMPNKAGFTPMFYAMYCKNHLIYPLLQKYHTFSLLLNSFKSLG
jgi:ankyrin repeat protein